MGLLCKTSFERTIQFQRAGSDSVKTKQNTTPAQSHGVFLQMDPFPDLVQKLVPWIVILGKQERDSWGGENRRGTAALQCQESMALGHIKLSYSQRLLHTCSCHRRQPGWLSLVRMSHPGEHLTPTLYRPKWRSELLVSADLCITSYLCRNPHLGCTYSRKKACFCGVVPGEGNTVNEKSC